MTFNHIDVRGPGRYLVRFIVGLMLCFPLKFASAQQTSLLTHYFYNPFLLNPANTGSSGDTRAFLFYRQQWVGIQNAPQTQTLTIDGPLDERPIGIGMMITNDVTNIIGRVSGMMSASYKLRLADEHELAFGMSAGIIRNQIHFDKIHGDVNDPGLLQHAESRTAFDGNAGLAYRFKRFRAGFASEQIFNRSLTYENPSDDRTIRFALVRHYLASFQYRIPVSTAIEIEPLVVFRTAQGLPAQFDANATLRVHDTFWANLSYKHTAGVGVSLGTLVSDRVIVGYNYEMATSALREASSGSHEVMIGFRFKSSTAKTVTSRNINSKIATEFRRENQAQYEKLDEISQRNETLNQQLLEYKTKIEEQQQEIERLKSSISTFDDELKATVDKLKVDLQTENTFDDASTYYLIIGAFKSLHDAKAFQREIRRATNLEPGIIQSETKTWYFVHSDMLRSPGEARQKIRNLDSMGIQQYLVGNPWIYKTKNK